MLGIFSNLDPTYGDYVASGIVEHSTGRLFTSAKGKGSFVFREGADRAPIRVSGKEVLDDQTKIYINEYYEVCQRVFSENLREFNTADPRAFTTYLSDVAFGTADLALVCTGKNNLEIAIGYGLIKEAGGVMVDAEGVSLDGQKYLEWGQKENLPVIVAATHTLAMGLLAHIRKQH